MHKMSYRTCVERFWVSKISLSNEHWLNFCLWETVFLKEIRVPPWCFNWTVILGPWNLVLKIWFFYFCETNILFPFKPHGWPSFQSKLHKAEWANNFTNGAHMEIYSSTRLVWMWDQRQFSLKWEEKTTYSVHHSGVVFEWWKTLSEGQTSRHLVVARSQSICSMARV